MARSGSSLMVPLGHMETFLPFVAAPSKLAPHGSRYCRLLKGGSHHDTHCHMELTPNDHWPHSQHITTIITFAAGLSGTVHYLQLRHLLSQLPDH